MRNRGSKQNPPPERNLSEFCDNSAKLPPSRWCPCSSRDITRRICGECSPRPPPTAPFWGDVHNKASLAFLPMAADTLASCWVVAHTHTQIALIERACGGKTSDMFRGDCYRRRSDRCRVQEYWNAVNYVSGENKRIVGLWVKCVCSDQWAIELGYSVVVQLWVGFFLR